MPKTTDPLTIEQTYAVMDLARILSQVAPHIAPQDRKVAREALTTLDSDADIEGLED